MIRQYRKEIVEKGQHSPEYLNYYVQDVIDTLPISNMEKIGDIGCGTGFHSNILKRKYPDKTFIGIDFSKATID
jgi:trans-aconitate methyltransferase